MLNIFKKVHIYVKISSDKIEVTNLETDQHISRTAPVKFSNNRLVLADFNTAEKLLRELLKELEIDRKALKILIQQIDDFEDGIAEIEKRALRDLGEQAGATEVYLVTRKKSLSQEESKAFLTSKDLPYITL